MTQYQWANCKLLPTPFSSEAKQRRGCLNKVSVSFIPTSSLRMLTENISELAERQFVCVSSEQMVYLSLVLVCLYHVDHTLATSHEYNSLWDTSTRKAVMLNWHDFTAMKTTDAPARLVTLRKEKWMESSNTTHIKIRSPSKIHNQ